MPALELKTWPGGSAWSRGMGRPLCSPLEAECALPRLRTLPPSGWSSRCLSSDRLSLSIQLSAKCTAGDTPASDPAPSHPGGAAGPPQRPSAHEQARWPL